MTIDVRHGRCGRVFVTLHGSFDVQAADKLHDLLAAADPTRSVIIDFRAIRFVEPLALATLAGEERVPGRRLTVTGLSQRNQRLLSDFARQPRN
jgi:anti-anti-sigma regulatory factor